MFTRAKAAPLVAEFLGAAMWAYVALVLSETTAVSYFIATSVAVALVFSYLLFGWVSGAHFNPATTFGMWTARKIGTVRAASYILAQLLGGVATWQLYQYFTNHTLASKTVHNDVRIWLAEAIGAAIVVLGYCVAKDRKLETLSAAVTVGAALFVGIIVAATASSGILNPAVALGERSFSAAYALGPLLGGFFGANAYYMLFVGPTAKVVRKTKV